MALWRYDGAVPLPQALLARLAGPPVRPDPLGRSLRTAAALLLRPVLRVYHRLQVAGREHLPLDRSFIIVANHASHLDTVCLRAALPLRKLSMTYAAAAADYFFTASLPRAAAARLLANALPFARSGTGDVRQSIATCRRLLERQPGSILVVYPEGTRSTDSEIGPFKRGIGDLVAGCDLPVVPCRIDGAFRAWPKGARVPRPCRVRLTFGAPRSYGHLERCKASAQAICQDLRQAVLELGRADGSGLDQEIRS